MLRGPTSSSPIALIIVVAEVRILPAEYTVHQRLVRRKTQAYKTDRELYAAQQNNEFGCNEVCER